MHASLRLAAPAALAALIAACASPPPRMCTEEALAAVNVHLFDPRTDAHLRGPATVEVRDGAFTESTTGDLGSAWWRSTAFGEVVPAPSTP